MEGWYYPSDELKEFGRQNCSRGKRRVSTTATCWGFTGWRFEQLVRLPALEAHREGIIFACAGYVRGRGWRVSRLRRHLFHDASESGPRKAKALAEEGRLSEHAINTWDEVH